MSGPALEATLRPMADKEGYITLEPVEQKNPEIWLAFKASFMPESFAEGGAQPIPVVLCDYASAGNAQTDHPYFKVWLPQLLDPRKME
jgi:hypothetical protein